MVDLEREARALAASLRGDRPVAVCLFVAGGGAHAREWLSSGIDPERLCELRVPYARGSSGPLPGSRRLAQDLADGAFRRAEHQHAKAAPLCVGVGLTAALTRVGGEVPPGGVRWNCAVVTRRGLFESIAAADAERAYPTREAQERASSWTLVHTLAAALCQDTGVAPFATQWDMDLLVRALDQGLAIESPEPEDGVCGLC